MNTPSFDVVAVRLGRLGDLVMTIPAVSLLVGSGLRVSMVTDEHHAPFARRIMPPTVTVLTEAPLGPQGAVLDLHGVPRSRPIVRSIRARVRIRVDKESLRRRGRLTGLTGRVLSSLGPPEASWPERHLEAARTVVGALGRRVSEVEPVPRLERPVGSRLLLGLVPGARHSLKRWPDSRWRALADAWRRRGGSVLAVLAPWETLEGVDSVTVPIDELPTTLAACEVVVAGDTGPLHLAAAMGVPTVGLFGPTPLDTGFGPWTGVRLASSSLACRPCSLHGSGECRISKPRCMEHSVEAVVAAIVSLWEERPACA